MVTLLVELKNEYTSQIVNILSPLIFQGIQSIYAEAQAIVKVNGDRNNTLKIFQSCLKSISDWNQITIIDAEDGMVFPSYCDSHTHLVHASTRESEWIERIKGKSYKEIADNGGGILNSAKKLQETHVLFLLFLPTCIKKAHT